MDESFNRIGGTGEGTAGSGDRLSGTLSEGDAFFGMLQQVRQSRQEFIGGGDFADGVRLAEDFHDRQEIFGMRTAENGFRERSRLDHILSACIRIERFADENDIGLRVESEKFSGRIHEKDRRGGCADGGDRGVWLGTADDREAVIREFRGEFVSAFEVSRHENQSRIGKFLGKASPGFCESEFFAGPCRTAEKDAIGSGRDSGDRKRFDGGGGFGGGWRCDIEFDRTGDMDAVIGAAGGKKPRAIEFGLDENGIEAVEDGTEEEAQTAIAGGGVVGNASVCQQERNLAGMSRAQEVGPEFGFRNDHCRNIGDGKHSAHANRKIDGQIDEDVIGAGDFFADGATGRGGCRENAGEAGVSVAQFADDLSGEIGLADGYGVDPDTRLFRQAACDIGGVFSEAFGEVRPIAAPFFHSEQEMRQQCEVGDCEEKIVEEPAHVESRKRNGRLCSGNGIGEGKNGIPIRPHLFVGVDTVFGTIEPDVCLAVFPAACHEAVAMVFPRRGVADQETLVGRDGARGGGNPVDAISSNGGAVELFEGLFFEMEPGETPAAEGDSGLRAIALERHHGTGGECRDILDPVLARQDCMNSEKIVFAGIGIVVEIECRQNGDDDGALLGGSGKALEDPANEVFALGVVGQGLERKPFVEPSHDEETDLLRMHVRNAQVAFPCALFAENVVGQKGRHGRQPIRFTFARFPTDGRLEALAIGEFEPSGAVFHREAGDFPIGGRFSAKVVPGKGGEIHGRERSVKDGRMGRGLIGKAGEMRPDIIENGIFKRAELHGATRCVEFCHFRFGVVLVFSAQFFGHIDEIDDRLFADRLEEGVCQIEPCTGVTRTAVEDAIDLGVFAEPNRDGGGVLHIDEIAVLAAVRIVRAIGPEEGHASLVAHDSVGFVDDRTHIALVVFARTEHIEVFEACHAVGEFFLQQPQIESLFRPAVEIERLEGRNAGLVIAVALSAIAVCCGGRGVYESGFVLEAPFAHFARIGGIVVLEKSFVGFGCRRAGPEMEKCLWRLDFSAVNGGTEGIAFHIGGVLDGIEVPLFEGIAVEVIDDQKIGFARLVELACDVGADQAGSACNDVFHTASIPAKDIRCKMRVVAGRVGSANSEHKGAQRAKGRVG